MASRLREYKQIYVGRSFAGNIVLSTRDGVRKTPFTIPAGATVEIHLPAATGGGNSVILSTANAAEIGGGTEVTVTNAAIGAIAYNGGPTKSALLNACDRLQPIMVLITDAQGNKLEPFIDWEGVLIQDLPMN